MIHECAPHGAASDKLRAAAKRYSSSQYFPDQPVGALVDGFRNENLECLTFGDRSIDLFITQDVMEHVLRPNVVVKEIAPSSALAGPTSSLSRSMPAARHYDVPSPAKTATSDCSKPRITTGARSIHRARLSFTKGDDFVDFVETHTGLRPEQIREADRRRGLDGEFLDVLVMRVPN